MQSERNVQRPGRLRRLLWFVAIWVVSVLALGIVAGGMRLLMRAAGMSN